jgi:hypothetical protein
VGRLSLRRVTRLTLRRIALRRITLGRVSRLTLRRIALRRISRLTLRRIALRRIALRRIARRTVGALGRVSRRTLRRIALRRVSRSTVSACSRRATLAPLALLVLLILLVLLVLLGRLGDRANKVLDASLELVEIDSTVAIGVELREQTLSLSRIELVTEALHHLEPVRPKQKLRKMHETTSCNSGTLRWPSDMYSSYCFFNLASRLGSQSDFSGPPAANAP